MIKATQLRNVILSDDAKETIAKRTPAGFVSEYHLHQKLEPVIGEIAQLHPTWTFTAVSAIRDTQEDGIQNFKLMGFSVQADSEVLGTIAVDRGGKNYTYKILINCPRIQAARQRSGGYATEDSKKAIAKVKKMFNPMTATERVRKGSESAADYIQSAVYRHRSEVDKVRRTVHVAAQNYVRGPGFEQFMLYVTTQMDEGERAKVLCAKNTDAVLTDELAVLENLRDQLGTDKSVLVVRDMDKYIVRVGDNLELYDDNTLPAELRGKLGMLKLVDKEHFVSGAGCRVTDDVFVLVA